MEKRQRTKEDIDNVRGIELNFEGLAAAIRQVNEDMAIRAGKAVNISLTIRNWLIGGYISEYELAGADRADYGDKLFAALSDRLQEYEVSNSGRRQLYVYLTFYRTYPQIVRMLSAQSLTKLPAFLEEEIVRTASALSEISPETLVNSLSYSHLEQLALLEDDTKRQFYEIECIRGSWSVRELKRQIASLYYERTGLSNDKNAAVTLAQQSAEKANRGLAIRDPYVFEFLGLKPQEVMDE
jgi:hypothetical protein